MTKKPSLREFAPGSPWARAAAFAVLILGALGIFLPSIGAWMGALGAAWFMGTVRPCRGFVIVASLGFVASAATHVGRLPVSGVAYLAWMFAGALLGALPYLLHRITQRRLHGLLSTLPLPLWGVAAQALAARLLPPAVFSVFSLAQTQRSNPPLMEVGVLFGAAAVPFLIYWAAALFNWAWDYDFRRDKVGFGAVSAGVFFVVAIACGLGRLFAGYTIPDVLPAGAVLERCALLGAVGLSAWALTRSGRPDKSFAGRPELVGLLRSPATGEPLHVVTDGGREFLASRSGERFPVRAGIPDFLKAEDITGPNRKYLRLYEGIGGLYDGTQKIGGALGGISIRHLFLKFVGYLEIKHGDRVLETSVGTGLVFSYLPPGTKLFGLDLSPAMLAACQLNLERWERDAELFRGNAECLPFADDCFDAVYHIGGINFFTDRAKAIREMIRVAKPGSRIVISDETEEHVKQYYEKTPLASGYYRNRKEKVIEPSDLVPAEMLDIRSEQIFGGQSYVLTFRKPG